MAIFKVACNNTEYFSINVEADSKGEALKKAFTQIENEGTPKSAGIFDREFDAVEAEELGG